ncbi:MAG: hypothetical protein ACM3JP_00705 [Betaproteobacteria bacterium]
MEPNRGQSGDAELERRYRRLLRAYPRGYRALRGEEMLATLLETATPGQQRPSRTDTMDILSGALRVRLGINAVPGFAAGLRIAGPINLVLATGFALLLWRSVAPPPMSTVVGVAWLLAAAVQLVAPRWLAWAVLVAWLATLAAAITVAVGGAAATFWVVFSHGAFSGPPGGPDQTYLAYASVRGVMFMGQLVCGLIALVSAGTVHWRPSRAERVAVVLAAVGLPGLALLRSARSTWPSGISPLWTYGLILLPIGILVFGAVMAVTRRSTGGLWAALLAYVGVTAVADRAPTFLAAGGSRTLAELDPRTLFGHDGLLGVWGLLFPLAGPEGAILLGAIVAVAVGVAAGPRSTPAGNALARLGGIALGAAAGVSLYELVSIWNSGGASPRDILIAASPAAAAIAVPFVPRWLHRPIILVALGTVLVSVYTDQLGAQHSVLALVLLLVIAAVSVQANAALIGGSAIAALGLVAFIAWYSLADVWSDPFGVVQDTAVPAVAALVLLVAPFAGVVAVLRHRRPWISGVLVFATGVFWILVQLQVVADTPFFLTLMAAGVAALLIARVVLRPPAQAVS